MKRSWMQRALVGAVVGLLGFSALGQAQVKEGQPAPDVSFSATQVSLILPGKKDAATISLKDLRGKNVVVYFFPKALTGG